MISEAQASVLGAVQGLTEFLPVSSSAHLTILPWLLGWRDPGLAFDVALHLGTLLALLAYYWRNWIAMASSVFDGRADQRRLLLMLVVASIPGAIFGLLLEHQAETIFRSPLLIATAMALLGVALWTLDRFMLQRRKVSEMSYLDALLIGLSQALALIPGVSRSGITMTMGRGIRLQREDAANFSFLMATPIIAGAGLIKAHELLHRGLSAPLAAGFITSAVFGWFAITGLLHFVRTHTYEAFAWYRIALAAIIVAVYQARL